MKERGEMLIIIKRLWLFISRYSRNFVLFLSFFFFFEILVDGDNLVQD